jgi:anti-sigma factor ChrR (cupin superfamily)
LEQEEVTTTLSTHLQEEDFEIYALGQLPETRAAEVEAHVAECQDCRAKLKRAIRLVGVAPKERRKDPRMVTDESAWLQVADPQHLGAWEVRIVDVSREGMSLRTRHYISRGRKVKLRRKDMIVFGEIRYCVPEGGEFRAGIKILEVL